MYAGHLGALPVAAIPTILNGIRALLGGSSYDATHQQMLQWASTILNDSTLSTASAREAWVRLRCWAGDQTVITASNTALLFGGGNIAQGCGCETAHGCRADAQRIVAELQRQVPSLVTGHLSTSPWTNPVTGNPAPETHTPDTGTIYTQLPGGVTVGIPVPGSTVTQSALFGVPVWALFGGVALLALSGRGRN